MSTIGIIMNGVTGRMGANQHLKRSILAIRDEGGVDIAGERVVPDPILVGRNADKLQRLAEETGVERYTTSLAEALADEAAPIYFDAQVTDVRFDSLMQAMEAGKHVYCEKPTALSTENALELYRTAERLGVKHGVVQDKLWLPGIRKLQALRDSGFFGRILSVRGEFGYWVFEGDRVPAQRPSWNYRAEDGGGIILDMFCHWRYVLDNLFGEVKALAAHAVTHIDERWDEQGRPYAATADDAAYALFELESGVVAQFNSSWTTRVRRDDLLTIQVDGTEGSAVAGLRDCYIQPYAATPKPVWNPDIEQEHSFFDDWKPVSGLDLTDPPEPGLPVPGHPLSGQSDRRKLATDQAEYENAFKIQWRLFLQHVLDNRPFKWNLLEGAKGVQLAELGYRAARERTWLAVPDLA